MDKKQGVRGSIFVNTDSSAPLISVIIPVYNVERYLEKCLKSVIDQIYGNLEIILVDDGSEDGSGKICDDYALKDSRIKVIHQSNRGLSSARNTGIAAAVGEYLCFVDSDDYVDTRFVQLMFEAIRDSGSQIAVSGFVCENERGDELYSEVPPGGHLATPKDRQVALLGELSLVVAWNKIYSRRLFDELTFKVGKQHEDEFIMHHILQRTNDVVCVGEVLYHYIKREGSLTNVQGSLGRFDVVEALFDRFCLYRALSYEDLLLRVEALARNAYLRILEEDESGFLKGHPRSKQMRGLINDMRKELPVLERARTWMIWCMKEHMPGVTRRLKMMLSSSTACRLKKVFPRRFVEERRRRREILNAYIRDGLGARFLLVDTPIHGNIGDQAIALAEKRWLESEFGAGSYYEITAEEIEGLEEGIARICPESQLVLVHGGGFLGCLWPTEERRFRRILKAFRKQPMIVLPQTVTFDMLSASGRRFFEQSRKAYSNHSNLTFCFREKKSAMFMKEHMPELDALLIPDMVLSLRMPCSPCSRDGVLLCMRRDHERALDGAALERIRSEMALAYPGQRIGTTDTVVEREVPVSNREKEVRAKLDQFSRANVVVTDRLHGMVLAILAETPCIALNNGNGKVEAVYEWVDAIESVQFVESVDDIEKALATLGESPEGAVMPERVTRGFSTLAKKIDSVSADDR